MATPPGARDHPDAVFYGDSIATGWRGTTRPRDRWTSLVSDELGWRETTLAIDGMGYYRRRGPRGPSGELSASATDTTLLYAVVRLAPDVVVVCLAANDLRFLPDHADDVHRALQRDLSRLAAELPGTPVVVTTYFPVGDLSERATRIEGWVAAQCRRLGLIHAEEFRRAVDGDPDLLCDDSVHPNDAGHAALAAAVLPVLRGLRLGPGR